MSERLLEWVRRVCPVDALTVARAGDPASARLQYADGSTPAQWKAAIDALLAFDWSPEAHARWEASRLAVRAIAMMATSAEPLSFTDRVINDALWTQINDERENAQALRDEADATRASLNALLAAAGLPPVPPSGLPDRPRILKAEIVGKLVASAMTGGGDPAQLPGG